MRYQTLFFIAVVCSGNGLHAADLTLNQKLIVACHRVDIDGVVAAIRGGAYVNARFGGDEKVFEYPWSNGWPMFGTSFTPLMALASASKYPDPPRRVENTIEDLDWAKEQQKLVPIEQLELRRQNSLSILYILLSRNPNLDMSDDRGATALYMSVNEEKDELATALLKYGARVNTKTGVYIDGSGDITPLHRAFRSTLLTKLLLEKGANPRAKDTAGKTPFDWAKQGGVPGVIQLYKP